MINNREAKMEETVGRDVWLIVLYQLNALLFVAVLVLNGLTNAPECELATFVRHLTLMS